jgi:hypothetical protein
MSNPLFIFGNDVGGFDSATRFALDNNFALYNTTSGGTSFASQLNVFQYNDAMCGNPQLDMSATLQAACDALCPILPSNVAPGRLILDVVAIRIYTTLNLTNNRVAGTHWRDGFALEGRSISGTCIYGETGYNHAVIETTGSQWLRMRNFSIQSGSSVNKSTIGVYRGVSTVLGQTQNQRFEDIIVSLHDDITANQGKGTIALYNFGAEENTLDTVYFTANVVLFYTSYSTSPNTGVTYSYSYQTLTASHSTGVNTCSGECFFVSLNRRSPVIITEDVNSLFLGNAYISNSGVGGTNDTAWAIYGAIQGGNHYGTIESHATAYEVFGSVTSFQSRITYGGLNNTVGPRIVLHRGGQGFIDDSDFVFLDNTYPNRPLFYMQVVSADEAVSCYIRNSDFKVNSDQANLTIQENIKWNPLTANVKIRGLWGTLPYEYRIGNGIDSVEIPPKTCLINGGITSAEIIRLILPSVVANNATGMSVHIKGQLSIVTGGGTNGMSVLWIDTQTEVSMNYLGVITSPIVTTAISSSGPSSSNTGANNITAGVISGAISGNTIQFILTPTRTGANLENVEFRGAAELMWRGNEARAPSLLLV